MLYRGYQRAVPKNKAQFNNYLLADDVTAADFYLKRMQSAGRQEEKGYLNCCNFTCRPDG